MREYLKLLWREWFDRDNLRLDRVRAIMDELDKSPVPARRIYHHLEERGLGMTREALVQLASELSWLEAYWEDDLYMFRNAIGCRVERVWSRCSALVEHSDGPKAELAAEIIGILNGRERKK